ncbi:nuclear transport factor 2 family protein [Salinispora fenicalii]|uniref:nuclear transport factor 2 family protein n=1 Tax=Salinispora fenicalii TaxID=1137263 RepID=UPI00036E2FCE|nr:nuclear transport factor 2 family protein [Salinispora fenicalii]
MSDLANTIKRYIDMWNETDATRLAEEVRSTCAENVIYTDPKDHLTGHEAVNALIRSAREQLTGMTFALAGPVDTHHNIARFTWHLVPAGATEPVATGFQVVTADDDGRLSGVYGFLDQKLTAS